MDFNLKQWGDQQHESEDEQQQQQPVAKIPRQLLIDSPQNQQQQQQQQQQHHQQQGEAVAAALPLFVSADSHCNKLNSHFSDAYSDHSSTPTAIPTSTSRFSRLGGGRYCFSMAQWQELEVQAVIYRHMVAGAAVPPELLHLVKKSLLTSPSSPYYLHHYPPHLQSAALLQAGYWGKGAMDPEPGRCRRTDGKKWRCSRDVVAGHKYCERHMHRGRNRSRKPVEFPASAAASTGGGSGVGVGGDAVAESLTKPSAAGIAAGSVGGAAQFSLSGSGASSFDAFQLHTGSTELRSDKKSLFDTQHDSTSGGDVKSNKEVLMHFFDDWPRSLQESNNADNNGHSSSTSLSMSTPGNPTSDFLRLSTGNGDELGRREANGNEERERGQISWTGGWGGHGVSSMGGPLAEALRSSSNSSPTSVLHQLPRCSAPDTSFVTA